MEDAIKNRAYRNSGGPVVAVYIYCTQCGGQSYLGDAVLAHAITCKCGGEIRYARFTQIDKDELARDGLTVKQFCDRYRRGKA